jgi:hypothetical protein
VYLDDDRQQCSAGGVHRQSGYEQQHCRRAGGDTLSK